jgi:hypothetical protein
VHTPLAQSLAPAHFLPVTHLGHRAPPQSTSVSGPFFVPSAHVAAWHLSGVPEQTKLAQSLAPEHVLPAAHDGHAAPPQSMSVSSWFFTTSEQLGIWQIPV